MPFEDSFRHYVVYFPLSFINDGEKPTSSRDGWITPKVLDQDTLPLIFKPTTMKFTLTTLLDDESAKASSNFKVTLGMILTG